MPCSPTVGLAVFPPEMILDTFGPDQEYAMLVDVVLPFKSIVELPQAITALLPALTFCGGVVLPITV